MKNRVLNFLRTEKGIALVYADFFFMGFIFHVIPPARPLMEILTPWVLLLGGVVLLFLIRNKTEGRFFIAFILVYVLTFALEAAGVATGKIFGPYSYGAVLGLKLFKVPLVIGFNWALIVFGLYSGLELLLPGARVFVPLFSGAGAVLFDIAMEPVAVYVDYWTWAGGGIPLRNYVAWFLIALLCAYLFRLFRVRTDSRLPVFYVGLQFVFFLLLRIFLVRGF